MRTTRATAGGGGPPRGGGGGPQPPGPGAPPPPRGRGGGRRAGRRPGRGPRPRGAVVDREKDRNVLAGRGDHGEQVEDLVVAEAAGFGIWPVGRVGNPSERVDEPSREQQHERRDPGVRRDITDHRHGDPPDSQVDRHPHPSRRMRPPQLQHDAHQASRPHGAQHPPARHAVERQQSKRRICAGDEHEDRGVIQPPHDLPATTGPRLAMVEGTHPEHGCHRRAIDGRANCRPPTLDRGERDHRGRQRRGQTERDQVNHTTPRGTDVERSRQCGGSHRTSMTSIVRYTSP